MKDKSNIFSEIRSATRYLQLCLAVFSLAASNTILADFDVSGTIQFSSATYSANESDGQATITLTRIGGSFGGMSVEILVGSELDTATMADYSVTQSTEISWADGDIAPKTFTINLTADTLTEGDEILSLSLQPSINNQFTLIGTPEQATLNIQDAIVVAPTVRQLKSTSGNYQRGVQGDTLAAFVVTALDATGTPVAGESVTWEILPTNGGVLQQLTTVTGANGTSSNTLTLNTSERMIVRATVGSGPPVLLEQLLSLNRATANTGITSEATFVVNGGLADAPGLSKNQKSVAKTMDTACAALATLGTARTAEQDDLLATCTRLASEAPAVVAASLSLLAHEEITAQGRIILETAKLQSASIHRRLSDLRMGSRGLSLAGLKINIDGQALPSSLISTLFGDQAKGGSAGAESSSIASRWGTFVNASVVVGDKDSSGQESGFDYRSRGITAGVDYRLSDKLVLGSALGYASKSSDFKGNEGELEIDNWHLSAYGSYFTSQSFYLDGLVRLGRNNIDSQRQISLSGSPLQMGLGDTTGWEYAASLSGGYEFSQNALTLSPYGRLGYIKSSINSYAETASNPNGAGAGSVLSIDSQNVDSVTAVLGGQLTYAISARNNVYLLQLNGEWEHEFRDNSRAIAAQFVYDPTRTSFNIDSNSPDRNYFNLGLGVSAVFANGRSGYLRYESRLGQDDVRQYWVNAGIRLEL